MAPHGDRDRVAGGARELVDQRRREAHRVVLLQADQAHLQRERAQAVAAAIALALDQPELDEAHEIGMRLGRRHRGRACEILQRQRLAVVREGEQQAPADLDALDAARLGIARAAACAAGARGGPGVGRAAVGGGFGAAAEEGDDLGTGRQAWAFGDARGQGDGGVTMIVTEIQHRRIDSAKVNP